MPGMDEGCSPVKGVGELGEREIGEEKPDTDQVDEICGISHTRDVGQAENLAQETGDTRTQDYQQEKPIEIRALPYILLLRKTIHKGQGRPEDQHDGPDVPYPLDGAPQGIRGLFVEQIHTRGHARGGDGKEDEPPHDIEMREVPTPIHHALTKILVLENVQYHGSDVPRRRTG
jgi:hypothetical protein